MQRFLVLFMIFGISCSSPPEEEMLDRTNEVRSSGYVCNGYNMPPAAPLKRDEDLDRAAKAHAHDMSESHFFDHTGSDGSSPKDRAIEAGYDAALVGENLVIGQHVHHPLDALDAWLESPGHCRTLMYDDFRDTGIYYTPDVGPDFGLWVQLYGRSND